MEVIVEGSFPGSHSENRSVATIETFAPPSRLYRFRPVRDATLDRELAAVRDHYVFCPTYAEMNDPMEGLHGESALFQKSRNYAVSVEAVEAAKSSFGIASFSENHKSEPMWAHYAEGFTGICIAYNFKRLLPQLPEDVAFVRMSYNDTAPVLFRDSMTAEARARMVLSIKTVRWATEREWRLIRPTRGEARYKTVNCVAGIYAGARTDETHVREVRKLADRLAIPFYTTSIEKYELSFKRPVKRRLKLPRKA